ncbi:MAG: metal-dependent hydrolase [Candidatus Latescibacterota bacterium]|nr:metal-dependent hydrolase [Candidatus Latescibacterota bacterium]
MRARGHLTGGAVVALSTTATAIASHRIPAADHPLAWGLAATVLFFSLFPDVDTASLPQRWFYKGVILGLLVLAWQGEFALATVVAAISMLPLIDHHRGWTHSVLSPVVGPTIAAAVLLGWRHLELEGEVGLIELWKPGYSVLLGGAVIGWYTHLFLDGLLRIFPPDPE